MQNDKPVYNAQDLSLAVGVCVGTARAYLRWRFPRHAPESWWRLDGAQFARAKAHLLELKAKNPARPLKGLRSFTDERGTSYTPTPTGMKIVFSPIAIPPMEVR